MSVLDQQKFISTLETLVNIPSPSGYTKEALAYIEARITDLSLPVIKTNKGAILTKIEGKNSATARLLTAHVDTLGAMVKDIKADGRLKLTKVGGFNWNATEGEYCQIHTRSGKKFTGTILLHETSVHVYAKSGEIARDDDHIEVRLDLRTESRNDTLQSGINVGDFVSFNPRFEHTKTDFIKSRHLDDKASVAILLSLLEMLSKSSSLPYTLYLYFSNNEEIGFGGNSAIPSEVKEYVAVDMGAMGDGQSTDEYTVSICAKDSSGPYHFDLTNQFIALAQKNDIPYKVDIYPFYGSDASAAIRAGYDIRHALIGPGIESSHAMERTHISSIEATFDLLNQYIFSEMIE